MTPAHAIDATLTPIAPEVQESSALNESPLLSWKRSLPRRNLSPAAALRDEHHRMPPCAACGHQYRAAKDTASTTRTLAGHAGRENNCCRCDGYDGCDVCERYYKCCTCRAAAMPKILKTLPGAWLQQTENGTAWKLSDDDVSQVTGAKGQRRVILRAAAKAGCVVLRENGAATPTLGDESDARRTIDEVASISQAELPADNERDAAVREAAAVAIGRGTARSAAFV